MEANAIAIEEIFEYLPAGYPLPDCAEVGETSVSYSTTHSADFLKTSYRVEVGWKEVVRSA